MYRIVMEGDLFGKMFEVEGTAECKEYKEKV